MAQREIEVILTRQLASYLAMPIFIVDPDGNLLFYNEPAERVLGQRFEETGEMAAGEWVTASTATDESGAQIPRERLPLMVALRERRPEHGRMWITGLDGVRRLIEITAVPLIGHENRNLGAVAIFWEVAGG
jgi:PAS domain-containing protein